MNRPVVAAIPNYNMAGELERLLPDLAEQDYADIYVLDDASTDHSRDVVDEVARSSDQNRIHFVPAEENRGAGAARNLILSQDLGRDSLIHFMDADTVPRTENIRAVANEVMPATEVVGFVGGLALNPKEQQNIWNYGPHQTMYSALGSQVQARFGSLAAQGNIAGAQKLRERFAPLMTDWPNTLEAPKRRQIFWNIEQNLLIDSSVFARLDGFDERLREHEIQDLAIRMSHEGLKRYFDPLLAVQHTEAQVRNYNRLAEMLRAEWYIMRKHGLRQWLWPDGSYKPSLD
jgi:N-acetylglucosaminyl-diphospho-decaprenol L-rhamnosyltransferase